MKPKHTGVWLYVPREFDPSSIPSLDGLHNEAFWLLHKIITGTVMRRHGGQEFYNVSRQTMEHFIQPSQVSIVRSSLIDAGVVECREQYKIGEHAQGYRVADGFQTDLKRVEVTKRSIAAKIVRHRFRRLEDPISEYAFLATERHLLDWLRQVKIDIEEASQIVMDEPESSDYAKACNRMTLEQIYFQEFDFSVCRFGRVHTPVTRLLTKARSCLSFQDICLGSLDIRNSQIVFFCLLLLQSRLADTGGSSTSKSIVLRGMGEGDGVDGWQQVGEEVDERQSELVAFGPEGSQIDSMAAVAQLSVDERLFVELTMKGEVYDFLMKSYNTLHQKDILDRQTFKRDIFTYIFYGDSQKPYTQDHPLTLIFRKHFPTVWTFIQQQKKTSYCELARRMQKAEADFMIHRVCFRLMNHHRDIPILTIHDSIMTPAIHIPTIHRIMMEEFQRYGITPTIKIDH